MILMISGYATGGRAEVLWWGLTFMMFYALFRKHMNAILRKQILLIMLIAGGVGFLGLWLITVSRFSFDTQYAIDSFIAYAGQPFNNFCAALPYAELEHWHIQRVFPLSNMLINHQTYDMKEFYSMLAEEYPIRVNVFFTLFGSLILDIGIIGMVLYVMVFQLTMQKLVLPKQNEIDFSALILFAVCSCIIVRGIFDVPFLRLFNSLYVLFSYFLYIVFRYKFRLTSHNSL